MIYPTTKRKNSKKGSAKIYGGTLRINGETAGYILDLNSFGEIKRNNFVNIKCVIVDEFISERLDKTTLSSPKKFRLLFSLLQDLKTLKYICLATLFARTTLYLHAWGLNWISMAFTKI